MDKPTAYVTADGTYGVGDILIFHEDALTDRQWEQVDWVVENHRYEYINAILNEDWQTVNDLEERYA